MANSAVFFGVEIPETLIGAEMQNHPADNLKTSRQLAGRALAAKGLLLSRAKALCLNADPEKDDRGYEETPEEALIRQVLSEEIDPETPSEESVRAIYDAKPEGFQTPTLLEASHILIAPEEGDNDLALAAHKKASELITLLQNNSRKFHSMAKTISACPSATDGGTLGQLGPGDVLGPIWEGLLKLKPGDIGQFPIRTEHGWHVIRLDNRIDGRRLPFDHVKGHIKTQLEMKAWTLAAAKYVDDLLKDASSDIPKLALTSEGNLASMGGDGEPIRNVLGDVFASPKAALDIMDDDLAQIVDDIAKREKLTAEQIFSSAVPSFITGADNEAWTKIISCLRDSENPLTDCLAVIVKFEFPEVKKPSRVLDIGHTQKPKSNEERRHDHCC